MNFRSWMGSVAVAAGLATASVTIAQVPAGSTGQCKDGSYTSVDTKRGACAGHGGVKDWYATTTARSDGKSAKTGAPEVAPTPPRMTANPAAGKAPASSAQIPPGLRATAVAPGGGKDKVWVNEFTHVYHCEGDANYGKTKAGAYMSEADAKAKGARPARGKTCA